MLPCYHYCWKAGTKVRISIQVLARQSSYFAFLRFSCLLWRTVSITCNPQASLGIAPISVPQRIGQGHLMGAGVFCSLQSITKQSFGMLEISIMAAKMVSPVCTVATWLAVAIWLAVEVCRMPRVLLDPGDVSMPGSEHKSKENGGKLHQLRSQSCRCAAGCFGSVSLGGFLRRGPAI